MKRLLFGLVRGVGRIVAIVIGVLVALGLFVFIMGYGCSKGFDKQREIFNEVQKERAKQK